MTWEISQGDCIELMAAMPASSIDAVVCDPPYGIGFMGYEWDQPGEHSAIRGNGRPGAFASGRPQLGAHGAGPVAAARRAQQKRATHPAPSGFTRERTIGGIPGNGGAMEAGRYDLSLSANQRFQSWCESWAREALRVLKPGGHLLASCGTRTSHRMVAGIEDAGFEIRDALVWLYGSGFPKSLDVGKAVRGDADRLARAWFVQPYGLPLVDAYTDSLLERGASLLAATEEWDGWGTALKPGHEPIVVARKPLEGTVTANVLALGTGALNIDGCRIGVEDADYARNHSGDRGHAGTRSIEDRGATDLRAGGGSASDAGRWPANVVLDQTAADLLDEHSGELTSGANPTRRGSDKFRGVYGDFAGQEECEPARGAETGGASRFFYCAKASRAERNAGLDGFEKGAVHWSSGDQNPGSFQSDGTDRQARNFHPTVKPVELMRWLLRLVTPGGGLVLDPFAGSGTTGCAAVLEGFDFIGCEREAGYVAIAEARIAWWAEHPEGVETAKVYAADRQRTEAASAGQIRPVRRGGMSGGVHLMLVGEPPPRCKSSTLIVVGRKARSKWWWVECFGQKSHYRKDGTCAHTDQVVGMLNPDVAPPERVRVKGWGGGTA